MIPNLRGRRRHAATSAPGLTAGNRPTSGPVQRIARRLIARHDFTLASIIVGLWVLSGLASAAHAANASVFLEDQTWTELRDRISAGTTTIIVPIGGTEQSGPAMALGKHNVRVKFLAEKIAGQLGNALVAPVISYVPEGTIDPPSAHMRFPGTITISDKIFEQLLESAARSFKLHGFRTIVLIGDHGGYQADERHVADRLNAEWSKSPVRVFAALQYYQITQGAYVDRLLSAGARQSEIGSHAGLADTSLMLAIDPSMVRKDRLAAAPKLGADDGVYGGDPTRSSAEFGQLGVDLIVNGTTEAIREFARQQPK
ncbi:creatininase [Mesorhizobium sp. WSM4312]|nr:creatininase [Mesorhizobium sp. WSM4312]